MEAEVQIMRDITISMLQFKEAIRHVWNVNFAPARANQAPEMQDAYDTICKALLNTLVLHGTTNAADRSELYRVHPLPFILIYPVEQLQRLPIRIGELDAANNTVYSEPSDFEVDQDSRIEFYDFFSWSHRAYVDLPYVRAKIAALPTAPSVAGRVALIEQQYCRFMLTE